VVVRDEVDKDVELRGDVAEVSGRHCDTATPGQRDGYRGHAWQEKGW
jgi:hypothetical protein